ncbi:MAG: ABC transporter ATP-binding protein, partial [Bryobacteraceae bacterium]
GGERNRYALARMLLQPSNFLLLDEPTNHLDMRAKDVLLESLAAFTGTVVFVSHDRYFLDKLATRIFEVADGGVHVFPGNYEDYLWRKAGNTPSGTAELEAAPAPAPAETKPDVKIRRHNPIKLKQMHDRCKQLEDDVGRTEFSIAECERELGTFVSVERTQQVAEMLEIRRRDLDALVKEWEEISATLEHSV